MCYSQTISWIVVAIIFLMMFSVQAKLSELLEEEDLAKALDKLMPDIAEVLMQSYINLSKVGNISKSLRSTLFTMLLGSTCFTTLLGSVCFTTLLGRTCFTTLLGSTCFIMLLITSKKHLLYHVTRQYNLPYC